MNKQVLNILGRLPLPLRFIFVPIFTLIMSIGYVLFLLSKLIRWAGYGLMFREASAATELVDFWRVQIGLDELL